MIKSGKTMHGKIQQKALIRKSISCFLLLIFTIGQSGSLSVQILHQLSHLPGYLVKGHSFHHINDHSSEDHSHVVLQRLSENSEENRQCSINNIEALKKYQYLDDTELITDLSISQDNTRFNWSFTYLDPRTSPDTPPPDRVQ